MHHGNGIRPSHLPEGRARGLGQISRVGLLDEVGKCLRVRFGREDVAPLLEAVAQLLEVLDDAVVDHRHVAGAIDVRVSVEIVRPPMGGPARVGEADRRRRRDVEQRGPEVGQLAGALLDEHVALAGHQRDARGVVAAVLEAAQALEQDGTGVARADVAHDSTHDSRTPLNAPFGSV